MILVDTSAWYATMVSNARHHEEAIAWFRENRMPLFVTDYIVDETLTLFRARGQDQQALIVGEGFFSQKLAALELVTTEDRLEAWRLFRDYADKRWSFTDCTSKVVMERLGIRTAFVFDHHFKQFGGIEVVP